MIDHDKIIQFIKMHGPLLPVQLSKEFKQDTIIMGAVLSELASAKKIFISNAKIGSSPVYYMKEQSYKLQDLYKHLNEKDQRAYDLLRQKKVLRDKELTPLLRVSLRQIKDFAVPITVKVGKNEELFWRWYLVSQDEAGKLIRPIFVKQEIRPKKQAPASESREKSGKPDKTDKSRQRLFKKQGKPKQESRPKPILKQKPALKPLRKPVPRQASEPRIKPLKQAKLTLGPAETAQKTTEIDIEEIKDRLHSKIKRFFNKKEITIKSANVIRKNTEIEYTLSVPSPVGKIAYYSKAKSKKRVNDSDLASAYVRGQMKKLPVLFIITGSLTKKAKEMLSTEFDNLKVVRIS